MRELQWTRFDEALPTDESKALWIEWDDGQISAYNPGSWDKGDCVGGKRWAYDEPVAPPREPEDERVVVSIKALREFDHLLHDADATWGELKDRLSEIIDSAEPVGEDR